MKLDFRYLLFVGGTSYRPWHFDLSAVETAGDQIMTLLSGQKIWLFCPMSRAAADLVKQCGAIDDKQAISHLLQHLQRLSPTMKKKVSWCEVRAGETVYMPYGCGHAVITFCDDRPSCMVSVDVRADTDRINAANTRANSMTAVGHRREY